jgi:hypothetical protein
VSSSIAISAPPFGAVRKQNIHENALRESPTQTAVQENGWGLSHPSLVLLHRAENKKEMIIH